MASQTLWTWVWASSRRWWRTGKAGMLQSMGSQRVGHDWATEQQLYIYTYVWVYICMCVCIYIYSNSVIDVWKSYYWLPNGLTLGYGASQVALVVNNLPAIAGDMRQIQSLGREDPLEEGMATLSNILAWRILWTEDSSITKNRTWWSAHVWVIFTFL